MGATWDEATGGCPELTTAAATLWPGVLRLARGAELTPGEPTFAIAYLATVRPDGGPRLHPFCPLVASGRLFAAIPPSSPKGDDLRRDGRCVIHAMPGPDDLELCIRACARERVDGATRGLVFDTVTRSGVGGMIATTRDHPLFEFDIERVDVARWLDVGHEGTRAVRKRWRAGS